MLCGTVAALRSKVERNDEIMDYGEMGIILAIIGIGLAIIGFLGNNNFNKLSTKIKGVETELRGEFTQINSRIEGVETRLKGELTQINSRIEGVETRLKGELTQINSRIEGGETRLKAELSRTNSEIGLLREQIANRHTDSRINSLENEVRSVKGLPKPEKGK